MAVDIAIAVVKHQVYVSDALVAPDEPDWEQSPHLWAVNLTRGCAPTIDQAALVWMFGEMDRECDDAVDGVLGYVDPLELKGKFIRIEAEEYDLVWYGYVVTEERTDGPVVDGVVTAGTQAFGAVGLEWFLSRQMIHKSTVYDPDDGTVDIDRAIGFNAGFGDGRSVAYDKRENRDSAAAIFADDATTAVLWTAEDIVLHLLEYRGPKDAAGNFSPIEFELADDASAYLDWFHPTVFTEGRSVWQVLNDVISHSRGLTWWLEVDLGLFLNEFHVYLRVSSMATSAVSLPGGATLPAALNSVAITSLDDVLDALTVKRDLSRKFDHVICRGSRRRAVFTVSLLSENLEPAWRAADETDYRTALGTDPAENDRYRKSHKLERVYQTFQIPRDWDGASNNGATVPSGTHACPKLAQGSSSIVAAEPINMPGLRLLRTMPIKVGYDYSNATAPTARDPDNTAPEWQRPFAVVDIDGEGSWRFTHDLADEQDGEGRDLRSFSLHCLDATPGLQFTPPEDMPHSLALNHFDPDTDGATDHDPLVDYELLRCTVCGEWDAYCEGKYPLDDSDSEPVQTLYIQIGERARLDWMAVGTIYDVVNGALQTVSTGGALRDDRELCVQIAQIAHQWYGVERAEVSLTTGRPELPADVGDLITTIGTGATEQTINAVVSQINYDFRSGRMSLTAGFSELDFAALA